MFGNFDFDVISRSWVYLFQTGMVFTLKLTALAMVGGIVLGTLLARGLISEAGRLETVGHPIQYATTFQFLQQFGLKSVDELPPIEENNTDAQAVEAPLAGA